MSKQLGFETLAILTIAGDGDHIVAPASLYGGTYNHVSENTVIGIVSHFARYT